VAIVAAAAAAAVAVEHSVRSGCSCYPSHWWCASSKSSAE